jgi:hypothetical protein
MLPERDEEAIDVDPVLLRQDVFESDHGAFWRSCMHIPPAVGDTKKEKKKETERRKGSIKKGGKGKIKK